jgi:hypothetical protein
MLKGMALLTKDTQEQRAMRLVSSFFQDKYLMLNFQLTLRKFAVGIHHIQLKLETHV